MLILNTLSGFASGGIEATVLDPYTFVGFYSSNTDSSSYTFSEVPFGPSDSNRVVVVAVAAFRQSAAAASLSGVTAGGVTLTAHQTRTYGSFSRRIISVRSGVVPSGNNGDVVVTGSIMGRCSVAVWVLNNLTLNTPHDSGSTSNTGSSAISLSGVTVPSGGFGMFFGGVINGDGSSEFSSWTNAADLGGGTGDGAGSYRGAEIVPGTGAAPTVTLNLASTATDIGMVGISFV